MLNQVVIVGRLTKDIEVVEHESGKKSSNITLAVTRSYKNQDNLYDTDFIRCILWNTIAKNAKEYCHVGDVIGVKGRLETDTYTDNDGNTKYYTQVVAERITFLSSKKANDVIDEEK